MQTSGIFFLRGRPASIRLTSPTDGWVPGWMLLLGERTQGRAVSSFSAVWRGAQADRFIQAHPALSAGACLSIDLDRLHAEDNELRGRITRCELAPSRWPAALSEAAEPADVAPTDLASHIHPAVAATGLAGADAINSVATDPRAAGAAA